MPTAEHINKDTLRRFSRLEDLSNQELESLATHLVVAEAPKRAELISLGSEDENTIYLVEGTVRLEAADGGTKVIAHTDPAAKHPISRLRPSRYRVVALTKVQYLKIENDQLDSVFSIELPSKLMDHYQVSELLDGDSDLSANYLMQIYKDLSQEAPIVPSWHKVSASVVSAIIKEKQNKIRFAEYLMLDPVLAAKVMHSGLRMPHRTRPLNTCIDAVALQDMAGIQKIAFMSLFQESIDPTVPALLDACRMWWEKSIRVAAVARTLAKYSERFDPDYLALAGLLHAIGEAVIIGYAHRFPEFIESGELQEFLSESATEVGRVLLTLWGFSHQFVALVSESSDWYREIGNEIDETDIILISRALVGNAFNCRVTPKVDTLPAYRKLGQLDGAAKLKTELAREAQFASDEAIQKISRLGNP